MLSNSNPQTIQKPHEKPHLTTRIGRILDRASYLDLLLVYSAFIITVALYFYTSPLEGSLSHEDDCEISFRDALYFTLVTFSSLGYGEYTPIGWHRLFASLTVVAGLSFFALSIGKIASERAQTTIFLIHRSDVQRRLKSFSLEAREMGNSIREAREEPDIEKLHALSKDIGGFQIKLNNYITFNLNQSSSFLHGNDAGISSLMAACLELQIEAADTCKFGNQNFDPLVARRFYKAALRTPSMFSNVCKHRETRDTSISYFSSTILYGCRFLEKVKLAKKKPSNLPKGWLLSMKKYTHQISKLELWRDQNLVMEYYFAVLKLAPTGPVASWAKGTHKEVATQLGISNSKASRYIDFLIKNKSLPK